MIRVRVPATTANLGPGFDCLGAALGFYNYIEMEFSQHPKITVVGEGRDEIVKDESNLVYKAASKILREAGINRALNIKLENHIPLARGLGSSAACIVGGMMAANRLCGDLFPLEKIMGLAAKMEGHPDNVVPALVGGFSCSIWNEDRVIYKSFPIPSKMKFVVAIPHFHLETKKAREVLPKTIPFSDAVFNISRTAMMVACFCSGDFSSLDIASRDKMHQHYRAPLIPGMKEILEILPHKGALGCFLSGAGPSVIGITFGDKAALVGESMIKAFERNNVKADYKIISPDNVGVMFL